MRKNQKGFSLIEALLILVIVGILGGTGWYVWHAKQDTDETLSAVNIPSAATESRKSISKPYANWKTATSPRGKFSFKYPSSWKYSQSIGVKDNVEHIVLDGPKLRLTIDSFNGDDPANGGNPGTKCNDCQQIKEIEALDISKLGKINLETITYNLDNGLGNAIILIQADGTYYIASPTAANVKTAFRGTSKLNSLQDYQNESPTQFRANPDLAIAKLILKSISY